MDEYYIRFEKMGDDWYYMIYHRVFIFHAFYERWNDKYKAIARLNELRRTYQ